MNSPEPWYRQFWPWFLFGLPAIAVVASLATVVIAFKHSPALVVDDYYRVGKAMNRDLAQDQLATALGVSARLDFESGLVVTVSGLEGAPMERLELSFRHNLVASLDQVIWLEPEADGRYRSLPSIGLTSGEWLVQLRPEAQGWRLRGQLIWPVKAGQMLDLGGEWND